MTDYTQAAADQIAAQQSGLGGQAEAPTPDALGAQLAAGQAAAGQSVGATDVDVSQLTAAMAAMQSRLDALERERLERNAPVLVGAAEQVRDLMSVHASGVTTGGPLAHDEGLRLADDAVEAAKNAVQSGDTGSFRQVAGRLVRFLAAHKPGPGDHPYYYQAWDRANELDQVADTVTPPAGGPALPGAAPVPVVAGSIVG